MRRSLRVALVGLALGCSRSAPADSPAGVSERFMDLYFIEVDQQRALPLTDGPARLALEKELREVEGIRQEYTPAQAKQKVYWERTYLREQDGGARAIYDVTIQAERSTDRRHVLLTMRRKDGAWKVTSFMIEEGLAPAPPSR